MNSHQQNPQASSAKQPLRLPFVALGSFIAVLLFVVFALAPGVNGAFFYDDFPVFNQLADVTQGRLSVWDFMASGFNAGVLGRPLPMISFLWPPSAYPDHTQTIFAINIVLHALNTLVVGLLAYRIGQILKSPHALWLGIFTAALWGLAPIQAATVLIAVQRMASLSALFVWLGLLLWVIGLQRAMASPDQGRVMQAVGLVGMTILAAFSKENGVLLPLFAGVMEATLFANLALPDRRARGLLYMATISVVFGYLLYSLWSSGGVYWERAFNVWERVITESVVLFEYLRQTLAPRFLDIHPFHDAHPVIRSISTHPEAGVALLAWFTLAVLAWLYRKRWPMAALAVLWYLAAHLLESTVLSLELYFEHRQYVAWFGPALALAWGALHVPLRYQKAALVGLVVYVLILGFLMRQTAVLWGNPAVAARVWFEANPKSPRAAEHLVVVYIHEGQTDKAFETHRQHVEICPECLNSLTLLTKLSCELGKDSDVKQFVALFFERAQKVPTIGNTAETLHIINDSVKSNRCRALSLTTLERMNLELLARTQPMFDGKRQKILLNLQQLAHERGDTDSSVRFLLQAYAIDPNAEFGVGVVRYLLDQQLRDKAQRFTHEQLCAPRSAYAFLSNSTWHQACLRAQQSLAAQ